MHISIKEWKFIRCVTCMFLVLAWIAGFKNVAIIAGSISENEDPHLSLLGLHGNCIKCQTSSPPLYHCGDCTLSANHYILVNLSLDQVTMRHLITWSPSVLDPKMWLLSVCTPAFICSFVSKLKTYVNSVDMQRVLSFSEGHVRNAMVSMI